MWWLLFVGSVIAFLVFCLLYYELRTGGKKSAYDPSSDSATNHQVLNAQSNSLRNQSSGHF